MNVWIVLPALAAVAVAFVLLPVGLAVYAHYRHPRVVTCPVAAREAGIVIAARNAAVAALVGRRPPLVAACSLWPGRRDCRQACLALPEEALREAHAPAV